MKFLPTLLGLMSSLAALAGDGSFQAEYHQAKLLRQSDPQAAIEGMKRSFDLAIAAGNADYATSAGLNAAYFMNERDSSVKGGNFAREVLFAIDRIDYQPPGGDALRRVQLFGLMERALQMDGRIGVAWQANRAAAETLRGKKVPADGDGRSITVAEVKALPAPLRSYGWRLIEREADTLDLVGRSLEARALLDEAVGAFGKNWEAITDEEKFYAFKIAALRCGLLDYIGYHQQAIEGQQDLLAISENFPDSGRNRLVLRINLLRDLSQWDGPSEDLLGSAREIGSQLNAGRKDPAAIRLLAKMELDLRDSQAALDALRSSSKQEADLGDFLESAYAARDSLMIRSKSGEDHLDAEFIKLLEKMRAQGNKRGEPVLYQGYGSYLLSRDRAGEASLMFQEALRLKRSFGLILHEPALLYSLFNARLTAGDAEGARLVLAELIAFIQQHEKQLPAATLVHAHALRALALGKLGQKDAALAALELGRRLGVGLPKYRRRLFELDQQERILNPVRPLPSAATVATRLRIQPLEVVTTAVSNHPAHTRFSVSNSGPVGVMGGWVISGPGVVKLGGAVHFTAGKPDLVVQLPVFVKSGGESKLEVAMAASDGIVAAQVRVGWNQPGIENAEASTWNVQWQPTLSDRIVLDASALETNPFRSISLFHEFSIPVGEDLGIPFRVRSPVPLRFEYYDVASDQLLAVDANGNGDLTESGDLHAGGTSGVACAFVPVRNSKASLTVEIRIFAPTGEALATTPALLLETEIYRNGAWMKEAESILK